MCNCNRNRLFCEFDKYSKEICLKLFSDNKAFIEMYLHFCPFQNPIKLWDDIFDILKYIYTGGELREGGGSSKVNENFWRTLQDGNWFRFWHHPLVLIFVFVFDKTLYLLSPDFWGIQVDNYKTRSNVFEAMLLECFFKTKLPTIALVIKTL